MFSENQFFPNEGSDKASMSLNEGSDKASMRLGGCKWAGS